MDSFLHTGLSFLVALGILIAFHEFGHYWVARKLGVKVTRFSLGFGKTIWKYQKTADDTEFVIASIPLGGYVKMVDEREGPVESKDLPFAFNRQSLPTRSAIVAAGPISNWILAVFLFWLTLIIGEAGLKPVLGPVEQGTIAYDAGFSQGDEILTVNGKTTPTWNVTFSELIKSASDNKPVHVEVRTLDSRIESRSVSIPEKFFDQPQAFQDCIGLRPWEPELTPIVDKIQPQSAAENAGLKPGDVFIQADEIPIKSWADWVKYVRARPNQVINARVERNGVATPIAIRPQAAEIECQGQIGKIGASVLIPADAYAGLEVEFRLPVLEALTASAARTFEYAGLSLKMMGRMLLGDADLSNLSGPISIAQYAGESAKLGIVQFLKFLAIVSISLAVLNLLPVPMLDGGHLLFFLIEWIRGTPLTEQTQAVYQRIGMTILIMLMSLAFLADIQRLLP